MLTLFPELAEICTNIDRRRKGLIWRPMCCVNDCVLTDLGVGSDPYRVIISPSGAPESKIAITSKHDFSSDGGVRCYVRRLWNDGNLCV